jgi:hypothetical protein
MLVTQWLDHDNRETRDIDFLGFGTDDEEAMQARRWPIATACSS